MGLVIGLAGTELSATEAEWLLRKQVAGVILFGRNIIDRPQVIELIAQIRKVRKGLLICVDQEGGRVARCVQGFETLPDLERIGQLAERHWKRGLKASTLHAKLMSVDMLAAGFDLSFAPVVDLKRGNLAIGNRAFSADPELCAKLAANYAMTMQAEGMAATIKHFPGHGSVQEDTHFDLAEDRRSAATIFDQDLLPFVTAIEAGARAVMTAHVSYPAVCEHAAGYSKIWLKHILRDQLGFQGVVFSDDISMLGGANVGTLSERIQRHYKAGCDLILVCQTEATEEVMRLNVGKRVIRATQQLLRAQRSGRARRMLSGKKYAAMRARLAALLNSGEHAS